MADLEENGKVSIDLLVRDKKLLTTRNGQPFLTLVLGDASGTIEGKVWDEAEDMARQFGPGDVIQVEGRVGSYRGQPQITIARAVKLDRAEVDPGRYLPSSTRPPEEMLAGIKDLAASLVQPLSGLCLAVLEDADLAPRLLHAPAAKMAHHAWVGGLVEHTLSVARLADRFAAHYPRLHRDLLVAGAILHDLGKAFELEVSEGMGYTTSGRLVGHITIGADLVRRNAPADMAPELLDEVTHLVISHHGQREYGSPQLPHTLEAVALSMADDLDAKMTGMAVQLDKADGQWTDFIRIYDRHLFKGSVERPESNPPLEAEEEAAGETTAAMDKGKKKPARTGKRAAKAEAEPPEDEGPGLFG